MSEEKKKIDIEGGDELREEAATEEAEAAETEETLDAGEHAETVNEADGAKGSEGGEAGSEDGEAANDEADGVDEPRDQASAEEIESERYMRLMAEFQNFKKRAAKEKSDIHAFANERIINDLLPVLDNFERALGIENEGEGASAETMEMSDELAGYAKGMRLIFEQLWTVLEKAGLKEIPALGEDFNPSLHNAVMTDSSQEYEDDKISKVMQKGYTLNDRVIRPSMVAVNKK